MRDLGIEGITGKTLMVSVGVPEGHHCLGDMWSSGSRAVEAGSRQLWGSGVIRKQGSRSPGLNRERSHTGSLQLESCSLHVPFFFFPMVKLYMLFEHQFSYLQSGVLTCLFFPPALHGNVNSTEAGINFSFNLQSHSSHSIPPGSLLGTVHTC